MKLYFCEKCHLLIRPLNLVGAKAVQNGYICSNCVPSLIAAVSVEQVRPPTQPVKLLSEPVLTPPVRGESQRNRRSQHQEERAGRGYAPVRKPNTRLLLIGAAAVLMLTAASIVLFVNREKSSTSSVKADPLSQPHVPNETNINPIAPTPPEATVPATQPNKKVESIPERLPESKQNPEPVDPPIAIEPEPTTRNLAQESAQAFDRIQASQRAGMAPPELLAEVDRFLNLYPTASESLRVMVMAMHLRKAVEETLAREKHASESSVDATPVPPIDPAEQARLLAERKSAEEEARKQKEYEDRRKAAALEERKLLDQFDGLLANRRYAEAKAAMLGAAELLGNDSNSYMHQIVEPLKAAAALAEAYAHRQTFLVKHLQEQVGKSIQLTLKNGQKKRGEVVDATPEELTITTKMLINNQVKGEYKTCIAGTKFYLPN